MAFLNFKQSFRNLQRNRVYTIINIVGLAVASAFIILVALYVQHALNMDKFSANTKNIYRVELTDLWSQEVNQPKKGFLNEMAGTNEKNQVTTPVSLALDLKKDFPEVENALRFGGFWQPVIRINNQGFKEDGKAVAQIDRDFFKVMGLPLALGNSKNPFPDKYSAVISERAAKKYFGESNPVGKTFTISEVGDMPFTVSGVAKNFPANSSLQFDIMTLLEADPSYERKLSTGTNNMSYITLLQLKEGTDIAAFQTKINNYGKQYFKSFVENMQQFSEKAKAVEFTLSVRPYTKAHMNISSPWPYYTDVKSMYQLILLALIALAIAALNYVLLSLSRVAARTQETGVRKTLGAGWKQIIKLFLTETQLLVALSLVAGFILAVVVLPYFNELTNVNILSAELLQWKLLLFIFSLAVLLSLIAGIYPALQMAGISPLNMLRKHSTYKVSPSLSKVFITLQYAACIVLIVFATVIAQQMNFIFNKDLGFDTDQVMLVENPYAWVDEQKSVALREQVRRYTASQTSFTGMTGSGTKYGRSNMNGHVINGKREYIKEYRVDFDFFELNKIPIVKGRSFSRDFPIDTIRQDFPAEKLDSTSSRTMMNIVVNETLYEMLGKPPLGEINRSMGSIIVGVCRDYIYDALFIKSGPMYHACQPKNNSYFFLKIAKGENIAAVTDKMKNEWAKMTGNEPFSFTFMQEDIKVLYESHSRWMKVINASSWLAIFIACLGLFGLSAVTAVNRTKEIGIRKVLGAGLAQLFYTLNKGTFLLVLLSIVVAMPVAVYIAKDWLQSFTERIDLHWSIFVWSGLIGIVCALIAVSFHTIKVSQANPVGALRND
jgi:putative ABC transport system permease protein